MLHIKIDSLGRECSRERGWLAATAQGHTGAFNEQRLTTVFPPVAYMSGCSASGRRDCRKGGKEKRKGRQGGGSMQG